jgi:hypothetical protein
LCASAGGSDLDHGAFKIEFFEADEFLRVSHSSKLGYVAYTDILNGKPHSTAAALRLHRRSMAAK